MSNASLPTTQHAVLIREFGEPEVMHYEDGVAVPTLAEKQVLVKIAYTSVNPVDYKTRQGKGWGAEAIQDNQFSKNEPAILGFDMAGEVVASNDDAYQVGDKVAALSFSGSCYAEYAAVDGHLLAKVPESVSLEQAGALPCIGQTALQFVEFADIKTGEHVVINAPAGGVGHLLIQLLAEKITNDDIKVSVICSPEKYKKLGELIDTSTLNEWIDYTKDGAFPELQADVLLDLVGGDAGVRALDTLKSGARVYVLPTIWVDKLKEAGAQKDLQVAGYKAERNGEDMARVLQMVADGTLTLKIQQVYPLSEAVAAHHDIQKGDAFGKIVLQA